MSTCIKELYDYDLVLKCSKCGILSLKSNFHKRTKSSDGFESQCKFCVNHCNRNYYCKNHDSELERSRKHKFQNREKINEYVKNRLKTDLNFKLASYMRNRLYYAYKNQNVMKTNKTFDLLGCSHSFFKSWIIPQLYGNMSIENYGSVWQINHCLAIASFSLLDENDMKRCFNWVNLRPMYAKDNIIKGDKINYQLYLLQKVKAKFFSKINNDQEGSSENIH